MRQWVKLIPGKRRQTILCKIEYKTKNIIKIKYHLKELEDDSRASITF